MEQKEFNEMMDSQKSAIVNEVKTAVEGKINEVSGQVNSLKNELNEVNAKAAEILKFGRGEKEVKSFEDAFSIKCKEHAEDIKSGKPFQMELKADVLMSSHLGAGATDAIPTIQSGLVMKPGQARNFTDLVQTVSSSTGLYWIYKEGATTGAPAAKTEGAASTQVEYAVTKEVNSIPTIAAHSTISREFRQDASFIQSALPAMLLRDFRKVQNTTFSTALVAAIAAASGTATVDIEQILDALLELEAADFSANGIVAKPANFGRMYKTKDSQGAYSLPNVVGITPTGGLQIQGVDAHKANWSGIATNQAIVGDFSLAKIVQAEGIVINFFDNDFDLKKKGLFGITIEARQALALDNASGFRKVDLLLA